MRLDPFTLLAAKRTVKEISEKFHGACLDDKMIREISDAATAIIRAKLGDEHAFAELVVDEASDSQDLVFFFGKRHPRGDLRYDGLVH